MRLRKLVRMGPARWWLLVRAQMALLRAHRVVRSSRTGTLTRAGGDRNPGAEEMPAGAGRGRGSVHPPSDSTRQRAGALAWAVGVMGQHGPTPGECLVQSLALVDLLRRGGLGQGRVRVGVRERNGTVDAHAWVEWGGSVLGDDPAVVAEYRPFPELQVMEPSVLEDMEALASPGQTPRLEPRP